MRGGDVTAAEAGSPRSPDLYDLSDDSDYAAAASDQTVLPPPATNSTLRQFISLGSLRDLRAARANSSIRSLVPVWGWNGPGPLYSYVGMGEYS
jgi:hypothetical protein